MKIESLMHRDVRATRPWDSALDALRSMWEGDCGALPVVDAGGRVTGIVTDRDLAMASLLRGQALSELQVDEVGPAFDVKAFSYSEPNGLTIEE